MKKIFTILLFFTSFNIPETSFAQTDSLQTSDSLSGVVIHADPRLELLMASNVKVKKSYAFSPGRTAKVIRSSKGFRLQIYNGTDKRTAISRKVDFMRKYPSVKTYMTYTQPIFRIKVGDFQTRREAQSFMSQISGTYSAVMIVPDYIVINTFHKQ